MEAVLALLASLFPYAASGVTISFLVQKLKSWMEVKDVKALGLVLVASAVLNAVGVLTGHNTTEIEPILREALVEAMAAITLYATGRSLYKRTDMAHLADLGKLDTESPN